MAISGPEALNSLEEALRDIRREEDEISKRLARASERITKFRENEADLLRQLAMVRLDPAAQAQLAQTISQAEARAREMVRKHAGELSSTEDALKELDAEAAALVDAVGLTSFLGLTAGELSYGRKRALEIATTLALDPEMMLLDEPMAGMGHEDIDKVATLIKRISEKYTILMVEHNLNVVANLSDTITVLTRGKVLAEGNYATLSKDERVKEAYLGAGHE